MDREPTNDLLPKEIFHCSECDDVLRSPVMLIENIGSVCYPCYKTIASNDNNIVALANPILDTMMRFLKWCCDSCKIRLEYSEYISHRKFCRYKMILCEVASCFWRGYRKDYITHFEKHTGENVTYSNSDVFHIKHLQESEVKYVILDTSRGKFVARITLIENIPSVTVLDLGYLPKDENTSFILKFTMHPIELRITCEVVDSNRIFIPFIEANTTTKLFVPDKLLTGGRVSLKMKWLKPFPDLAKQKHTNFRRVRRYECPTDCGIIPVTFSELLLHMESKHDTVLNISDHLLFKNQFPFVSLPKDFHLIAYNHLFCVRLLMEDNKIPIFNYSVSCIGPKKDTFVFEIQISDSIAKYKSLTYTDVCYYGNALCDLHTLDITKMNIFMWNPSRCSIKFTIRKSDEK